MDRKIYVMVWHQRPDENGYNIEELHEFPIKEHDPRYGRGIGELRDATEKALEKFLELFGDRGYLRIDETVWNNGYYMKKDEFRERGNKHYFIWRTDHEGFEELINRFPRYYININLDGYFRMKTIDSILDE